MENPNCIEATTVCHVVAMPYPGRGHINPMMNLCKLLASKTSHILITFVVTEEWLGFLSSDSKPPTIRFATIPNVIPSERVRALDFDGFYEAVMTKLEDPFQRLIHHLQPSVTVVIADVELRWITDFANRKNIPVAAFWTSSVVYFSALYHFQLFAKNQNLPIDFVVEKADKIPGISSSDAETLQKLFHESGSSSRVMKLILECVSKVPKAQCLLFSPLYELEPQEIETIKANFQIPVYSIGPAIPYLQLQPNPTLDYQKWLDSQPEASVLYVSLGSFLSVSNTQMDEIAHGLGESGVPYIWVAREEAWRLKEICSDKGLVLPWCDQLKVLCHSCVGGFLTHCGWNSTMEAVFAGVPMLTFPLAWDQHSNCKKISDEWKVGWEVERKIGEDNLVSREEIAQLITKFMDLKNKESKELRMRARELRNVCQVAVAEGGSSAKNLDALIGNILGRNWR